jgi:hypothetical protein
VIGGAILASGGIAYKFTTHQHYADVATLIGFVVVCLTAWVHRAHTMALVHQLRPGQEDSSS